MNFIVQNDFAFFFPSSSCSSSRCLIQASDWNWRIKKISQSPWFATVFDDLWPLLFCRENFEGTKKTTEDWCHPPPKTNQPKHLQLRLFLIRSDPNPVSTLSTVTPAQTSWKTPPVQGFLSGASHTAGRTRQTPRIWHEHHRPSCPLWNLGEVAVEGHYLP